jgi:DNA end-binding protein Ku
MRPIWTRAISFGLLHIPVKLYSASKERALKFEYLRKQDLCPIGYVKVCKNNGEEVPWKDIVKGYQYQNGDFVILTDADFKQAALEKSGVIDIEEFVDEQEINPLYYVKPYYVGPDHKSDKVYNLLLEVLKRSRKVGIGKFVLRTKEHIVGLKAEGDILVLNTLRMSEEINQPTAEIKPKNVEISEQELDMAVKLIDKMSTHFKPEKLKDDYTEKLEEIIEAKAHGTLKKVKGVKLPEATKVPDLMSTLKASLEQAQKKVKAK